MVKDVEGLYFYIFLYIIYFLAYFLREPVLLFLDILSLCKYLFNLNNASKRLRLPIPQHYQTFRQGEPGEYVRLSKYYEWIETVLAGTVPKKDEPIFVIFNNFLLYFYKLKS